MLFRLTFAKRLAASTGAFLVEEIDGRPKRSSAVKLIVPFWFVVLEMGGYDCWYLGDTGYKQCLNKHIIELYLDTEDFTLS